MKAGVARNGFIAGIVVIVVFMVFVGGMGIVAAARTDEFDVIMDAAIANNGLVPPLGQITAADLYTYLNDGNPATTPLVVDLRNYSEYSAGHIPGAINIYYRDLGKKDALNYLNSQLAAHNATKKNEIVTYGNTHHLKGVANYLASTQGFPVKNLKFGFAEWTKDETVAPGRFKECNSFDPVTGKGNTTETPGCTSNNFTTTTANPINASEQSGEGYPTIDCIDGPATSADLAEIARCMYDWRYGNLSKPDYRITSRELYDLLNDGDPSNDPYVLSNRGTNWNIGTCTSPGAYYDRGHIPSATAVDWCSGNDRQELRVLDSTDFMPPNKLIVHHCWVGQSQQYGNTWYPLLGYNAVTMDYGMNGWSDDSTVRQAVINPTNWYPNDYSFDSGDPQAPYVVLKTPSNDTIFNTTTINFSAFILEGGIANVSLWGNWDTDWHRNTTNDSGSDVHDYNFTVDIPSGTWVWNIQVFDNASNEGWDSDNLTITVDTGPPNLMVSFPVNGTTYTSTTVPLNFTVVDDNNIISWMGYTLNGADNQTISPSVNTTLNISNLKEGANTLMVYVNDSFGKWNSSNVSFTLDAQPPYTVNFFPVTSYEPTVLVNENQTINITWADAGTDVNSSWLDRNGSYTLIDSNRTGNTFTWKYNEANIISTINVTIYANDTNGNTNSTSFTYDVVNNTVITILSPPTPPVYYNTKNISIKGRTTLPANITYRVNGGPNRTAVNESKEFSNYTNDTQIDYDSIHEGINNVTVYAVKEDNPADNDMKTVYFNVDTIYPTIEYNLNTTADGNYSRNWTFVNVSANDTNLDTITLEVIGPSGANFTSWNGLNDSVNYWRNVTFLNDGQYTLRVYVNDSATNTNVTIPDRIITLDTTPPVITITSPSGTITDESVTLTYHVSDATTSVNWHGASLDGGANITGNQTFNELPHGQHTITVYANDTVGNMRSSTVTFQMNNGIQGSYNDDINSVNATSCTYEKCSIGMAIVNITGTVTGSVGITRFNQTPDGINPLNRTTNLSNDHNASGVYIRINSSGLTGSLASALLRIYYNASDLDMDKDGNPNEPQVDINPNELWIYRYNESTMNWTQLTLNRLVNTTSSGNYDGYIQANITNFSYFSFGGALIPVPVTYPQSSGAGGYIPYIPAFIPTVVLTSSGDWHYAMLAAGFAAANDYAVMVNPSKSLDLAVRNNIQWFRRLIIFGGESIISKDVEGTIKNLSDTFEPGFFGIDIIRVNGSSFYDASTLFVDRWKDPDGKSTAKGIILTRGDVFTDTLVASQLSGATSSPIIYTAPTKLPPWTKAKIQELGLDVTIIGGKEAVSQEIEDAIKALGVNVTRIGGKDRYETAALVADEYVKAMRNKGKTVDTITFLSGETGDWANTFGIRSYEMNSVILLVKSSSKTDEFPKVNKDFISTHPGITHTSIITTGNIEDDFTSTESYLREHNLNVDPNIKNSHQMNKGDMEKNYTISITDPVGLSTSVTGDIRDRLKSKGKMLIPASGGGGGGGGGGGQ